METQALSNVAERMPSVFDDLFTPWNEWFDYSGLRSQAMNVTAVNITECKDEYQVSLAAPGLKKNDFKIDVNGNMLTISSIKKRTRKKKTNGLPGKSTAIPLSAAVSPCPKKSTKKKLKQSMKMEYLKFRCPAMKKVKNFQRNTSLLNN